MRTATVLFIAALLLPSAWLLWNTSDVPRFGELHDDSLYMASAKSLVDGGGYRIESLPGEPAQTKYPPLYPLLLSIAWRVNPTFPENLPIAVWLSWLAMPAILMQLAFLYPRMGFSDRKSWILMALFATNSYVLLFSTQLLTELVFLALTLAAMLLLERALDKAEGVSGQAPVILTALAGAVGGLSYLTRSAALALLAAAVIYLWFRKQRKLAGVFAGAMLPFVIGWMAWTRTHQLATDEPALIYYVDYFRYHLLSFDFSRAHIFLWKNIDGLLWGLGSLIVPKVTSSIVLKVLSQVLAVAMISGTVRLLRRGRGHLYAWFALFSAGLLVIWHFPPNERFVLPLFPLALAGLLTEAEHFIGMLKAARTHPKRDQRIAATAFAGFAGLLAVALLTLQVWMGVIYLPEDAAHHRQMREDREDAYAWIRQNTPPDATLLSSDDAVLYLNTGRHAMTHPLPPQLWYNEDHDGMVRWGSDISGFAAGRGLDYFDFAGVKTSQGLSDDDSEAIESAIAGSPNLDKLYEQGEAAVYAIRPKGAAQVATGVTR